MNIHNAKQHEEITRQISMNVQMLFPAFIFFEETVSNLLFSPV